MIFSIIGLLLGLISFGLSMYSIGYRIGNNSK